MRTLATREAVFEAAEKIAAGGDEPSSRAVREEIGGGSLATIQRHLRVWNGEARPGDRRGPAAAAPQPAPAQPAPEASNELRKLTETVERLEARIGELSAGQDRPGDEDYLAVKAERDALKDPLAWLSEQIEEVRTELAQLTAARDAAEAEVAVCRQILNLDASDRSRLMQSVGASSGRS